VGARHVSKADRGVFLIEVDDGTQLTKADIAAALLHPEAATGEPDVRQHRS
jgi:hypothetical protein